MADEYIEIDSENLPKAIRELRQKKSMTQKQLANQVGVKQQTISAIENGTWDPSFKLLLTIAGILGLALLFGALSQRGGENNG